MLTGDNERTAKRIATTLGIERFHAGVTPQEKHTFIASMKRPGAVVGMAGDGINDAPALAEADVGIAMGTGTDIAMETAPVTLVRGDLRGIVHAIQLGRAMMRNIRQNLLFAFLYNALGIPIAAGVLYPVARRAAQPDDRRCGHEFEFRVRHRERAAAEKPEALSMRQTARWDDTLSRRRAALLKVRHTSHENLVHSRSDLK
jgi:hypothetical protein